MCVCNPKIKAPYCGKPGCQWPQQLADVQGVEKLEVVKVTEENIMGALCSVADSKEPKIFTLPNGKTVIVRLPNDEGENSKSI